MRAFIKIAVVAACAGLLSSEPARLQAAPLSVTQPDAVTPDGGRYYGPLVGGMRHGHGRVEWDNGSRYEGEFAQGLFSGHGRLESEPAVRAGAGRERFQVSERTAAGDGRALDGLTVGVLDDAADDRGRAILV